MQEPEMRGDRRVTPKRWSDKLAVWLCTVCSCGYAKETDVCQSCGNACEAGHITFTGKRNRAVFTPLKGGTDAEVDD
jgi:hypothetical protein